MKVISVRTLTCPDCHCGELEHVGVAIFDDDGIYLIGVCPDCRDVCRVPIDRLEWSLRNEVTGGAVGKKGN